MRKVIKEETVHNLYKVLGRFTHSEELTVQELANLLRAVESVVTVIQVDHDFYKKTAVMKIKVITSGSPQAALSAFKKNALRTVPGLKKVEFAMNTLIKQG